MQGGISLRDAMNTPSFSEDLQRYDMNKTNQEAQTLANQFNRDTMDARVQKEILTRDQAAVVLEGLKQDQEVSTVLNKMKLMEADAMARYVNENGGVEFLMGAIAAEQEGAQDAIRHETLQRRNELVYSNANGIYEMLSAGNVPQANAMYNQFIQDYTSLYGEDPREGLEALQNKQSLTLNDAEMFKGFSKILEGQLSHGQAMAQERLKGEQQIEKEKVQQAGMQERQRIANQKPGTAKVPAKVSKNDVTAARNWLSEVLPKMHENNINLDEGLSPKEQFVLAETVAQYAEKLIAAGQANTRPDAREMALADIMDSGALTANPGMLNDTWEFDVTKLRSMVNNFSTGQVDASGGNEMILNWDEM